MTDIRFIPGHLLLLLLVSFAGLHGQDNSATAESEDLGPPSIGVTGERWAVVVGISDYQDTSIEDLQYAHRDAQAFGAFLSSPRAGGGGFAQDHVLLMTNQHATSGAIRTALFDFLPRAGPDDVVYFFFAGHGMPAPGRPNTQYLIPHDGHQSNFAASALRMVEVEEAVTATQARIVMFIDACHSAAVGAGGARGNDINRINAEFMERITATRPDVAMMVAARVGEYAQEGEQWGGGHGAFTFHLLEGLNGRADRDQDRIVDLGELSEYVTSRVRQDTDHQQTPVVNTGTMLRDLPMSVVADDADLADLEVGRRTVSTPPPIELGRIQQEEWFAPDSITTVIGTLDTVTVRLSSPLGEMANPRYLGWTSTNPGVARVDEDGVVTPVSEGVTTINAYQYDRDIDVLVRVYPDPVRVEFSHPPGEIETTQFDHLRLAAVMELPDGRIVNNVPPRLTYTDTSALAPRDDGMFEAIRPGNAVVTASLAGESLTWSIRVLPPLLAIDRSSYGAVRFGDTIALAASYVRPDRSRISEAGGVTWQSDDTAVVRPTPAGLVARRLGRTTIRASTGTSRDSMTVFVLGDLVVTSEGPDGPRISTISMTTGAMVPILEDEFEAHSPTLSPDGRTVAFVSRREPTYPRIYLMDADGSNIRRLTEERGGPLGLPTPWYQEHSPVWSADGSRVFFVSNNSGSYDVYSISVEGDDLRRLTRSGQTDRTPSVAPDGSRRLAFARVVESEDVDIWVALQDGTDPVNVTGEQAGFRESWIEARPALVNDRELLMVENGPSYRDGESLVLFDIGSRQRTLELVRARRDHKMVYAVSPAGDRVAYTQQPRLGNGDPAIVVLDLEGRVVGNINLAEGERILDMSWGAVAASARTEGEES